MVSYPGTVPGNLTVGGTVILSGASGTVDVLTARITGDAEPQMILNANGRIEFGGGSTPVDVNIFRDGSTRLHTTNSFATEGSLVCDVAGGGLSIKEGANARSGVATLVAGTVTVANTSVTANTRIFLTPQTLGTIARPAAVGVTARVAATSFTITSGDAADTSTVAYLLIEPA